MKLRNITLPPLNAEEMADIVAYLALFNIFGAPGNPDCVGGRCGKSNVSTAIRSMAEAARGRRT